MYSFKEIKTIFENCNTIEEIYHARFVFKTLILQEKTPAIKVFFIRKMNRERLIELTKKN